jgi:hypothetical protein
MSDENTSETPDVAVASEPAVWLSGKQAGKRLEMNPRALGDLVKRRLITARIIPGRPPKYLQSSLDQLLVRSTIRAVEPQEAGNA